MPFFGYIFGFIQEAVTTDYKIRPNVVDPVMQNGLP
jgi:hypothetical protein